MSVCLFPVIFIVGINNNDMYFFIRITFFYSHMMKDEGKITHIIPLYINEIEKTYYEIFIWL